MYTIKIKPYRFADVTHTYNSNDVPRIGDTLQIDGKIFTAVHGVEWVIGKHRSVEEIHVYSTVNMSFGRLED